MGGYKSQISARAERRGQSKKKKERLGKKGCELLYEASVLTVLGASIYDVRTEGGGGRGVSPKEDVVREVPGGGPIA